MMKSFFQKNISTNSGYTLVEIVIVVVILSMIVGAVGLFQSKVFSLNYILQSALFNQSEAKKILKPFANEIRGASQSNTGSYPIETAGTSTLVFYSDIDDDGLKERIRYFLDGTDFVKGVKKPTGRPLSYTNSNEQIIKVIHDVVPSTKIFTYYDSNYDGTATSTPISEPVSPEKIRLIKIDLMIDSDPSRDPGPIEITTQTSIRNLKDNL